jgi:hypothetical protein
LAEATGGVKPEPMVKNPKSETRNPKEGRKSEIRKQAGDSLSFGLRASDFLRISDFGLRISLPKGG